MMKAEDVSISHVTVTSSIYGLRKTAIDREKKRLREGERRVHQVMVMKNEARCNETLTDFQFAGGHFKECSSTEVGT